MATVTNDDSGATTLLNAVSLPIINAQNPPYSAVGNGIADDTSPLASANTAAVAAGLPLALPSGTYLIKSNLTITANLAFYGGVLKPASGVTIQINGPLTADLAKIFDVSLGGTIAFGGPTLSYANRSLIEAIHPEWWGINGNVSPYDTAAVQAAINSAGTIPVRFSRDYWVTTITIANVNNGLVLHGNHYSLHGAATSATDSIVVFRPNFARISELVIAGDSNTNYTSGMHWFPDASNTSTLWNVIRGLRIENILQGLVIGSNPGGAAPFAGPLGDNVYDFETQGVLNCIYVDQPNAKVTFFGARAIVAKANYSGTFTYNNAYCVKNVPTNGSDHGGAELSFFGGVIQNNDGVSLTGSTCLDIGGNNSFDGVIIETAAPSYIRKTPSGGTTDVSSGAVVVFSNCKDFGGPPSALNWFTVDSGSSGKLIFQNCFPNLPAGSAGGAGYLVQAAGASTFEVEFKDCQVMEWPFPFVNGCVWRNVYTRYFTYTGVGGATIAIDTMLHSGTQLLGSLGAAASNGADSTEDILFTMTLPAYSMMRAGDAVIVNMGGSLGNGVDTETVRFYFGTASDTFNAQSLTPSASGFSGRYVITRQTASAQSRTKLAVVGATPQNAASTSGMTQDLTTALTIKVTGQDSGSNAGQITLVVCTVELVQQ